MIRLEVLKNGALVIVSTWGSGNNTKMDHSPNSKLQPSIKLLALTFFLNIWGT
jgi:hypothetical protein